MDFNSKLAAIKESLNNSLTAESPKETIDLIAKVNGDLDDLAKDYSTLKTEKTEIQDMYIKSIRTAGSTEKPQDEEPPAPKTLEQIGQEIISNRK